VFANDARNAGRTPRRRRFATAPLEGLEARTLLAWTPLGFSLPDLVVTPSTPPVAAYGGPLTVQVDVSNLGHSSMLEPLALAPGATSRADAGPSVVGVYLSTNPHKLTRKAVRIGEIEVAGVRQNGTLNLTEELRMPTRKPRGFPGSGGQVYVWFRADARRSVPEIDRTNNDVRAVQPLQIFAPLPELALASFEAPPVLNPGDVIAPSFQIGNYGTVDTSPQGEVLVQYVASSDTFFGPTDLVLASYFIPNIDALSEVPSREAIPLGDVNLDPPTNLATIQSQPVTLPSSAGEYYVGLIIDPNRTIRQISDLTGPRSNELLALRRVGPRPEGYPAALQVRDPSPEDNVFPIPAFGPITSPFFPPGLAESLPTTTITSRAPAGVRFTAQQRRLSAQGPTRNATSSYPYRPQTVDVSMRNSGVSY
jgi:hypothetical protein